MSSHSSSDSSDVDVQIDNETDSSGSKETPKTPKKSEDSNSNTPTQAKVETPKTELHLDTTETKLDKSKDNSEMELHELNETKSRSIPNDKHEEEDADEEEEYFEEEEEEEEPLEPKYDFLHPSPILKFQYRSISATLIRAVNLFRNSMKLSSIAEDNFLTRVAMKHSLKMASEETKFSSAPIKQEIASQPYAYFYAHVSRSQNPNHAFLSVANEWATDPTISQTLLSKANVIGVGMATSMSKQSYFTVIVALRSYIGDASLVGDALRSTLLGLKCLDVLNKIRTSYKLQPYVYDQYLSQLCYKFCSVPVEKLTQKFVASRLPNYSATHIDFGFIKVKDANPVSIVEEWMKQVPHVEAILGDYNRIGIGFIKKKNYFASVRITIRSLHASIIDGTEVLVDNSILAKHVAEEMNEFREQHSLQALNLDEDLFKVAQEHAEYIANGSLGDNPIESDFYTKVVEPRYRILDISHTTCKEMSKAPKAIMKKWRNNTDCVSVLLNLVDDIGVGLCFDEDYICHVTTIIADTGEQKEVVNKIVSL